VSGGYAIDFMTQIDPLMIYHTYDSGVYSLVDGSIETFKMPENDQNGLL